jgi:predicted MFS family arabinose efflux permease
MDRRETLHAALALGLGAAVALGLARFSYALLVPGMRVDLDWSYLTAGAMNTANAAGYLAGALLAPRWLARFDARRVLLAGAWCAAALLALHGVTSRESTLYALRALTGVASAATFVAGGLMAARLGESRALPPTLILGLYYGGTGAGIVASALIVPVLPSWQAGWFGVAAACALAAASMASGTRTLKAPPVAAAAPGERFRPSAFVFGLASYFLFGLGYIGYMTFVVELLRDKGLPAPAIVTFYAVLGLGVMASSWLWAGLLQRFRGGVPMAVLNGLLTVATLLPVTSANTLVIFASGALFGAVFLSVVASTTALVRHNAPRTAWASGIAAFTIVFAAGQIVGPSLVGFVADGAGGLARGFVVSAAALAAGALLALGQREVVAGSR